MIIENSSSLGWTFFNGVELDGVRWARLLFVGVLRIIGDANP
jgi:hypothetical protein